MAYKKNGKRGKRENGRGGREREREREGNKRGRRRFSHFSLPALASFPSSFLFSLLLTLSPRLLLLVVDRDGDDGRAASDHADGGEAPLELAVGHLC